MIWTPDHLATRLTLRLPAEPSSREAAAAVALVLRLDDRGAPEICLMTRAERRSDPWSGQVSLPGGRRDPGDPDLLATARRETREEVEIDLADCARVVGRLPPVEAMARRRSQAFRVWPFVFVLERDPAPTPRPGPEAQDVFWFPLEEARCGQLDGIHEYQAPAGEEDAPRHFAAWQHEGRVVWGMTHRIIGSLFATLAPGGEAAL